MVPVLRTRLLALLDTAQSLALRVPHRSRQRDLRRKLLDVRVQQKRKNEANALNVLIQRAEFLIASNTQRWAGRLGALPAAQRLQNVEAPQQGEVKRP